MEAQTFVSEKFGTLRTIIIGDEPWFAGKDAATSLEYKDTDQAIRVNVDERDKKIINAKVLNQMVSESKPVQQMASESNSVQYTGLEFNSPRGLIFINLSGLFSLILSSRMEKAQEYRHWVTSEVLPKIHGYKSGTIVAPPVETSAPAKVVTKLPKLYKLVEDAGKTAKALEKFYGVKYGIALAKATEVIEELYKIDLTKIKALVPAADYEIATLTPTQIGKRISQSPQYVNKRLLELELQIKNPDGDGYILTEKGKTYAEAMPYTRNGHSGYQIKWLELVVALF